MSKRPNLADIASAAGSTRRPTESAVLAQAAPEEEGRAPATRARTRRGTRQVAAHFPEEVAWQLRELAVDQRSTVQDLLAEALNDLFQKHGKPELAPVRQKSAL